jgi:PemK-like, MazF-like toxin of type II toxin-antitoxin system
MWDLPEPGDIVWCRFPQRPRDVPGPKPRPALVVIITEHADGAIITVAYGTSQKTDRLASGEFAIRKSENKAAYEIAGLSYDTKFDLRNRAELPWNDTFFAVPPNPAHGQTPKLGSLHIGMERALKAAAQAIR